MAGRLSPVRLRFSTVAACAALLLAVVTVLAVASPCPRWPPSRTTRARGSAKGHAKGVVIVGYEPGTSKVQRGQPLVSVEATDVTAISPLAPNTVVVKLPPGQTVEEAITELEQQPGGRYAEPDYYVEPAAIPDDPYYTNGRLWGMYGDATTPDANQFGAGAGEAWAAGLPARQRLRRRHRRGHPGHPPRPAAQHLDEPAASTGVTAWTTTGTATSTTSTAGTSSTERIRVRRHRRSTAPTWPARSAPAAATASAWPVWTGTSAIIPAKFIGPSSAHRARWRMRSADGHPATCALKRDTGLDIVATNNSWGGAGSARRCSTRSSGPAMRASLCRGCRQRRRGRHWRQQRCYSQLPGQLLLHGAEGRGAGTAS